MSDKNMASVLRFSPPGIAVRFGAALRKLLGLQADAVAYTGALREVTQNEFELQYKGLMSNADEEDSEFVSYNSDVIYPTGEEEKTLRRVPDSIPWNAYLIAIVELAERFSYYGSTAVFTNFIQQKLPQNSLTGAGGVTGQSGALGLGQRASTGLTTLNSFWVNLTPFVGAYIADTYWGRYKTICVSVVITLVGHILLVISSLPSVIVRPNAALVYFVIALIVMGSGTGGFKSNISPLVAEQYQQTKLTIKMLDNGERVIVDPALTISRIYMYFYMFVNIGALVGQILMTYAEKYVGYYLSYTIPTVIFLVCPLILWYGNKRYVKSPPQGSVLTSAFRIWRFATRGRWSLNPFSLYRNMTADDIFERAKPSNVVKVKGTKPAWMTFDDKWVDEVRRGFKACTVFVWYPIYSLAYSQLNNNLTSQAATMATHGLPNDLLSNLDPLALIIVIPICDLILYPAMRRVGIRFTPLKRITAGFLTCAAAMAWAAMVQHYIYTRNPCGYYISECPPDADGNPITSDLNVWIQSGSYILIAMSEILASITGLEYAFTKAPKNMRSLVMSVYIFTSAIAAVLAEAFVSLSADPLLVWNYGVVGVLVGIAGILFWYSFRHLDAEEDALNELDAGQLYSDEPG